MYHSPHNPNMAALHAPPQYSGYPQQYSHALIPTQCKKEDGLNISLATHYVGNAAMGAAPMDESMGRMDLNEEHIAKTQRASISIEKKVEICEVKVRENLSNKDLAAKYNISQAAISSIVRRGADYWRAFTSESETSRCRLRYPVFPEIERTLLAELATQYASHSSQTADTIIGDRIDWGRISDELIKERAIAIADRLNNGKFKASSGWIANFKKRKGQIREDEGATVKRSRGEPAYLVDANGSRCASQEEIADAANKLKARACRLMGIEPGNGYSDHTPTSNGAPRVTQDMLHQAANGVPALLRVLEEALVPLGVVESEAYASVKRVCGLVYGLSEAAKTESRRPSELHGLPLGYDGMMPQPDMDLSGGVGNVAAVGMDTGPVGVGVGVGVGGGMGMLQPMSMQLGLGGIHNPNMHPLMSAHMMPLHPMHQHTIQSQQIPNTMLVPPPSQQGMGMVQPQQQHSIPVGVGQSMSTAAMPPPGQMQAPSLGAGMPQQNMGPSQSQTGVPLSSLQPPPFPHMPEGDLLGMNSLPPMNPFSVVLNSHSSHQKNKDI